ncbi:MAG TPA: hypothetical protein VKE72_02960 [Methylocella sp.]|nr:hypothetical protein [Methylocella sp.]
MRRGCKAGVFAIISAVAFASAAAPPANAKAHHHYRQTKVFRTYIRGLGHGGIVYAGRVRWAPQVRGLGYVNLVGDPESGLGFYALPLKYRIGAWRYRASHRHPWWHNPVLFAIGADAARYNYWIPGNHDYAYGVFNPYDGVGTPFFGGYYGRSAGYGWP